MFNTEFTSTNAVFQSEFAAENEATFKTEFVGGSGKDGASAYEVAVANGFVGTEEEWLESLKGADGYTPKKGVDYFDGEKGDTGADGKDGINGKDGDKGEKGDPGEKGDTGEKGQDGKDGYTPQKGIDYYTDADKMELIDDLQERQTFETWTFTLEDGTEVTKEVCVK